MASLSAVRAADDAIQITIRRLFQPFRLEHWIVLGFLALLDQCSRIASASCQVRMPVGNESDNERVREVGRAALAWLGDHPLWAAAITALVLTFVMIGTVVVLWITSRGRFMYLDNVATGRLDIRRPWTEHAGLAGSHFAWMLGSVVAAGMLAVGLALPVAWALLRLFRHGPRPGPIAALAVCGVLLLLVLLAFALFGVAMRDFVAPLQWFSDVSCGAAVRLFLGLLRAHTGAFALYLLLKLAFSLVAAMITLAACCCCCCVAIPFFQQVLLQPVFYFERRWSVEVLGQLGFGPPGSAHPVATPVSERPYEPTPEEPSSPPPPPDEPPV